MLRAIFGSLAVCATLWVAQVPALAQCDNDSCRVLEEGHVRGTHHVPNQLVCIPYIKHGYGQVALFALRDFNPNLPLAEQQQALDAAIFKDSKITGPIGEFCRNPAKFAGARWIVLCDTAYHGWIGGKSVGYVISHGRPSQNRRVHVGSGL